MKHRYPGIIFIVLCVLVQVILIRCFLANTRDLRNVTHLVDGSSCVACRLLKAFELIVTHVAMRRLITVQCLEVSGVRGCHRWDMLGVVTDLRNL